MDDVVVCVLDVKLLPHERTLVEHRRGLESILEVRKHFQESIGATFMAAVEHMTGRQERAERLAALTRARAGAGPPRRAELDG